MMRIAIICLTVFIALSAGSEGNEKEKLAVKINRALMARCIGKGATAVRVIDVHSGDVLYDKNGAKALVPASVMKLVTTASALHHLGPAYRFETDFLHGGQMEGGVISGDLFIRGKGDPKLTPEAIWLIAEELARRNITKIKGDIVVDDTFFDQLSVPPSWSMALSQKAYDAKIGALSVNFNTIAFHIYPGDNKGDPLIVGMTPQNDQIKVINKTRTILRGVSRVHVRKSKGKNGQVFILTGALKPRSEKRVIYRNVDTPWLFAGEVIAAFLKNAGIMVEGKITRGKTPEDAKLLYTHKSPPLSMILRDLNRYSNNFIAEQIVKTISAEVDGAPGSHRSGLELSKKFLDGIGVNTDGIRLACGSGRSRKNRLTARSITDLLRLTAQRFDIGPDFVASLGIMGVDGSVRKRLAKSPAKANARAKTGTLNGVSALAGYVAGKDEKLYAYAIMQNRNKCYYKQADAIEDKIVTAVFLLGQGGE
ncbi:D-alanyl-D-alanine carboxypeptidase [hydrothermal vent metagenome]|uniref:D-alanyl-D-alanine carboxypeptidase n=1 Tax=hydrothermal vent metagenome TaxID=652676 RepID=A0A3B1C8Z5_9ZZZZ